MIWRGKHPGSSRTNKSFLIEYDAVTKQWVRHPGEMIYDIDTWLDINDHKVWSVPEPSYQITDVHMEDGLEWFVVSAILAGMADSGIIEITDIQPTSVEEEEALNDPEPEDVVY